MCLHFLAGCHNNRCSSLTLPAHQRQLSIRERKISVYTESRVITGVFVNRSSRKLIKQLAQQVEAQPLTLVVGASGTGKSSLVKAGVLPYVRHMLDGQSESNNADEVTRKLQHGNRWHILPVVRPTEAPLQIFIKVIELLQEGLTTAIRLPSPKQHQFTPKQAF